MTKEEKKAAAIYKDIYKYLDSRECKYTKRDDGSVEFIAESNDIDINCRFLVNSDLEIISFLSPLPMTVREEYRVDMALAVSAINSSLIDGSFDFDYLTGNVAFRITSSYRNSIICIDCYDYLLEVSRNTVDDYNDKLLLLSLGKMTVDEIIDFINSED